MATLNGDTIHITVLLGISAAFGYQIALVRDTAVVRYVMSSDFYEVANGEQHKLSIQLTSYFETEPLVSDTIAFR